MKKYEKILVALMVCGLSIGLAGSAWKMFEFRDRLHAITDNARWEQRLSDSGVYQDRRIVFFGDSQIANWPMAESFGALPIMNRGIVGDWALTAGDRFDRDVLAHRPDTVIIEIGTNDLGHAQPIEAIAMSIDRMVKAAQLSGAKVVVCSLLPARGEFSANHPIANIRALNTAIQAISEARGAAFLDMYSLLAGPDGEIPLTLTIDGLHANSAGYARMTAAVRPLL